MSDRATFVSFLLDETGSMQAIKDDTIGGFNAYLEKLQEGDAEILFSLVSFNSNETRRRYVAEPVRSVEPLAAADYQPSAMTPLIDAAVKIIEATAEAVEQRADEPNVVVVMQTDGLENVSVEYDHKDLAALIKAKTAAGWEFVFLGAGLDAFAAARAAGMHLDASKVVSYARASSREVFAATAENISKYAEAGDSMSLDFSPEQREEVGDVHTRKYLDRDGDPSASGARRSSKKKGDRASTADDYGLSKP